mgnify:FL=1
MIADQDLNKAPDQGQSKTTPPKNKVSVFRLFSDLGSYLFNRHSDASSLTRDISELEAERAAARSKAKQAKSASPITSSPSVSLKNQNPAPEHVSRIKHLEEQNKATQFSAESTKITIAPTALKTAADADFSTHHESLSPTPSKSPAPVLVAESKPMPTASSSPVASSLSASTKSSSEPVINATKITSSPVAQAPEKHQDLLDKKIRSAQNLSEERVEHTKQLLKSKIENRAWNPYGSAQVNLIKEHRSMFFNWQSKMLSMIFFVLLTCLICVLAYGYLLILEKEKQNANMDIFANLDSINQQIAVIQRELDDKIVPFNDKLMYTGYMLDNHIYWTNFFQFLEQETLSDVYYSTGIDTSINGNVKGTNGIFEIWSVAKNFNTISNQTKVFAKSKSGYILSVVATDTDTLSKSSSTPGQIGIYPADASQAVRFKLKLTIDPRIFLRDK